MSGANDNDMTVSRRIQILERGIEQSRKDLEVVEGALKERRYPAAVKGGGLHRRRMMLLNLITDMEAKLKELRAVSDSGPEACK